MQALAQRVAAGTQEIATRVQAIREDRAHTESAIAQVRGEGALLQDQGQHRAGHRDATHREEQAPEEREPHDPASGPSGISTTRSSPAARSSVRLVSGSRSHQVRRR